MKLQISRIYLAGIGHTEARADPLTLTLLGHADANPEHSLLFLRNAGGKTSLMRELFSMLHPAIVERIGREDTAGRTGNLVDYILRTDTAHVVVEWRRVDSGKLFDDWTLLTGMVAEWRGEHVTRSIADLNRAWYSISGPFERASLEQLQFFIEKDGARHRIRLRAFREELAALARGRGAPAVETFDVQQRWVEHLDSLGLDRVLLRYMGEMNHSEAGASAIARWRTEVDFIRFFVKTVIDPGEVESLQGEIAATADKIRRLPDLERQLRFEQSVHAELGPLAESVRAHRRAEETYGQVRSDARLLLRGFEAREGIERERATASEQRARDRGRAAQQHESSADRWQDSAREHDQTAARFAQTEAEESYAEAQRRDEQAGRDVQAWRLTEDLARRDATEAELGAIKELAAKERERFAPLEQQRDEAARALASTLTATATRADTNATDADARASSAADLARAKRKEQTDALTESAGLEADARADEARLESARSQRQRLVAKGFVKADEPAPVALARETARESDAHDRRTAAERERGTLATERLDLEREGRSESDERIRLERSHTQTARELDVAEAERAELAADPLVLQVAQETIPIDVEALGTAVAERLRVRAVGETQRARELDLAAATDRRAISGLTEQHLLPAPLEVERALDALAGAGISAALAATHYAANAMNADERTRASAARPDLVAGIVLSRAADLPEARRVLDATPLTRSVPLVVGPAQALYEASARSDDASFVLPPSDAAWDTSAAEVELLRLTEQTTAIDAQRAELLGRADTASQLVRRLLEHLDRYPVGFVAAQRALRDGYASELERLGTRESQRISRLQQIDTRDDQLQAIVRGSHEIETDAAAKRAALTELVETEQRVAGVETLIVQRREEARAMRELAEVARHEEEQAQAEGRRAEDESRDARRLATELRAEVARLAVAPGAEAALDRRALPELRARYGELDQRVRRSFSESEILQRLDFQGRQLATMRERIAREHADLQARAGELVATADGTTAEGRAAALRRAQVASEQASQARREAYAVLEDAKRALREITETIERARRSARLTPKELAPDQTTAKLRAAEARTRFDQEKALAEAAERDRAAAEQEHKDAIDLARTLRSWIDQIGASLGPEDSQPPLQATISPTEGDRDTLDALGKHTRDRLLQATNDRNDAQRLWRERDDAVMRVVVRPEFAALAQGTVRLYDALRQQTAEERATRISELLIETQTLIRVVEAELAAADQDLDLATTALAKTVGNALAEIRNAERSSRLPESLHGWAGEPFLRISIKSKPATADEIKVRLRPFVTNVVGVQHGPVGDELLVQALLHAVAGFSVEILKPNESFEPVRVPITELASFSGGQRATAVIALMLMFSELRRRSRAATRDASLGTLILDNPLGNANAGFLLDVQLAVARAAGIQLVYLSGIQDLAAIRRFPNFVALANSAAQKTGWRYIRADDELRRAMRPDDDGPGGKLSAARVSVAVRP